LTEVDVAIVGGGIAGLACAAALLEAGRDDVLVFERAARCGGPIESTRVGGCLIERGPSTVRRTPELEWLFAYAGIPLDDARPAAPYVAHERALLQMPPPVSTLLRGRWIPLTALLGALAEPLRSPRPGPRSVKDWVAERLGAGVAVHVADLLTLGSFGAASDRVGFESGFPELAARLERAGGRLSTLAIQRALAGRRSEPRGGVVACADGLGALPAQLHKRLDAQVRTGTEVMRVSSRDRGFELTLADATAVGARRVVLALPPTHAAGILEVPSIGRLLENYSFTPQTLATFRLDDPQAVERWPGLGFLSPTREQLPLLGCLFPSNLFPDRAPQGSLLLTAFLGAALRNASGRGIAKQLGPLLRELLGGAREPELLDVARHPDGIPLYDLHHRERTRSLRALLADEPGLHVAGWGYDGIGLGAAIASGAAVGRQLAQ
jgi:oxygen-dependent protoporphyrinogen oxidase